MNEYLSSSPVVDCDAPAIQNFLTTSGWRELPTRESAERAFQFVRDEVAHSYDAADCRVTISASDALRDRVGLCYSKSHLLAALLRGLGIPAAIRYQRLRLSDESYCLHSFNAVWLEGVWNDLDARGNTEAIRSEFLGPLAFSPNLAEGEETLAGHFSQPAKSVLMALALALAQDALTISLPDRV